MYLQQFTEHFPIYVECMKATDHNSPYHLEGSVWTHTCMVYSAIKMFRPDSRVLLIAAILHDIGKIKTKTLNAKGNHSFSGHEGVSTFLATDILPLWNLTTQEKQQILTLISIHGVCSSQINIPYLRMFRAADITGRICANPKGQSDYEPRKFRIPSDSPEYTVTMLIGLPCAGKSTYAATLGLPIISRDDFLMSNFGEPGESYNKVYTDVHNDLLLRQSLDSGFNAHLQAAAKAKSDLVIDMTMLSLSSRRSMMTQFQHARFKAIVFLPRLSTIEARNATRPGKFISDEVYFNMMKSFVMPVREEGFESISIILENS